MEFVLNSTGSITNWMNMHKHKCIECTIWENVNDLEWSVNEYTFVVTVGFGYSFMNNLHQLIFLLRGCFFAYCTLMEYFHIFCSSSFVIVKIYLPSQELQMQCRLRSSLIPWDKTVCKLHLFCEHERHIWIEK